MRTFLKDVRFGLRVLWKSKGFTAVAVLTLGLGIGVNAAIFSGVNAFVLRPLSGVGEPESVMSVFETSAADGGGHGYNDFSYPDLLDYGARTDVFEGLLGHTLTQAALGERERADVVWGELVTGNFFDVLRVRMQHGRGFLPEEDATPGTHPVVVLSDDLWRKRFGADAAIVGRQIQLNGRPLTVVGIAPPEFTGAKWALGMKFWAPLMSKQLVSGGTNNDWTTQRGNHWLEVKGRLKPGVTREQAAAALTSVAAQLESEYPAARNKDVRVIVIPEREGRWDDMGGVVRLSSGLALALVGLVLLVACANVANMMLARAVVRRREIGIRLALGAGRWRVVRQLLTESVLLALAGGAVGLVLSFWMTDALTSFFPQIAYTIALDVSPDRRALLFTLAVSLLTGLVFGLAPALPGDAPRPRARAQGRGAAGGARAPPLAPQRARRRAGRALAGRARLRRRSSSRASATRSPSTRASPRAARYLVSVNPGLFGYEKEQGRDFYRRLAERVRATPGVEAAGFVNWMPLGDSSNSWGPVYPAEQPVPPPGEGMDSHSQIVSAGYFKAMRIPLVEGRDFDERDREGLKPEAVIINETLARRLWPGEASVVGKRMALGPRPGRRARSGGRGARLEGAHARRAAAQPDVRLG